MLPSYAVFLPETDINRDTDTEFVGSNVYEFLTALAFTLQSTLSIAIQASIIE